MQVLTIALAVLVLLSVVGMVAIDAYGNPTVSNRLSLAGVVLSLVITLCIVSAFN